MESNGDSLAARRAHSPEAGTRVPLRLLMSTNLRRGELDGAWWPQSRDLAVELADLADHFPHTTGKIDHVAYWAPDWVRAPCHVEVASGAIKTDQSPDDDTHAIRLLMSTRETLHVMVVPAATAPERARHAMTVAASPTNLTSAQMILEHFEEWPGEEREAHWTDAGDAWWDPNPVAPSSRDRR
jgi:Family of unknown function (DUF5994)